MPFINNYKRKNETKVSGHYRLNSIWNFWFLRHEALSAERGERPLPEAVAAA